MAAASGGIKLTFTVAGEETTLAAFKALPLEMQKKVLRPAVRAGAKIIHAEWKRRIHSRSGATAASLKVRAAKRSRKFPDRVTVNVITAKGWFKGATFYAAITELGWLAGSKKAYMHGGHETHRLGYRWIPARFKVKGKFWGKAAKEAAHGRAQAAIHAEIKKGIAALGSK